MKKKLNKIAIIGMGYVGLPLAIEFQKYFSVIGFDINENRIERLKINIDETKEVPKKDLIKAKSLFYTSNKINLSNSNIYIVCVPTPLKKSNQPDLKNLKLACNIISEFLKKDDLVIFESTVYPGATEEVCVPILEKKSGLIFNKEFSVGYSPERINPGDRIHRIVNTVKITSGSNPKALNIVDKLYKKIVKAGTFKASSIKAAEAAKIIENTQRDLNIALINEFSVIFDKMKLDTYEILKAAETKWNFISFKPGLVGGHCIGVDPYYLTYKAKNLNLDPKVILAGREVNDNMSAYLAKRLHQKISATKKLKNKILIMGVTFKEDCPDIRNSKVFDVIRMLKKIGYKVDAQDPYASYDEVLKIHKVKLIKKILPNDYDAVLISLAHSYYHKIGIKKIKTFIKKNGFILDLKNNFNFKNQFYQK